MPTVIHCKAKGGAFSSDVDNDGTSAFNQKSIAIRSGVGFMARGVGLEHVTV